MDDLTKAEATKAPAHGMCIKTPRVIYHTNFPRLRQSLDYGMPSYHRAYGSLVGIDQGSWPQSNPSSAN
ncbi:MAG: hypothetical protein RLZZ597_1623 [Cyanobacteriota bacterium]|jgi:hypothetical protein